MLRRARATNSSTSLELGRFSPSGVSVTEPDLGGRNTVYLRELNFVPDIANDIARPSEQDDPMSLGGCPVKANLLSKVGHKYQRCGGLTERRCHACWSVTTTVRCNSALSSLSAAKMNASVSSFDED